MHDSKHLQVISMEPKNILVASLVVLAVLAVYVILQNQPVPEESPVEPWVFVETLEKADKVYIVMDVRNASSSFESTNILQCGTDFAGSSGLAGKELVIFAMNESECATVEGKRSVQECVDEFMDGIAFHIVSGDGTTYYKNRAEVGVNESYKMAECRVDAVVVQ